MEDISNNIHNNNIYCLERFPEEIRKKRRPDQIPALYK